MMKKLSMDILKTIWMIGCLVGATVLLSESSGRVFMGVQCLIWANYIFIKACHDQKDKND